MTTHRVKLRQAARTGKHGVVTVRNPDGSLNREYKISGDELAELHASGNGFPPGCTREEWESGRAVCYGRDYDPGDYEVFPNGAARIMVAETIEGGRFFGHFLTLDAGEYTLDAHGLSVTPERLAATVIDRTPFTVTEISADSMLVDDGEV